jgi:hypothetical protein
MSRSIDAVLLAFFTLFPLPALSAVIDLPSAWLASAPKEPGGKVAWEGIVLPLGETPLSVAVRNDGDSLYVRVRTSDSAARHRIQMTGLTVWVDKTGKSRRGYGLRFPVGGTPRGTPPPEAAISASEMELIGPGEDDRLIVPAVGGGGAWARLEATSDLLTMELRFPLHGTDDRPLAVESAPGSTVSIGFETEKPRRAGGEDGRPAGGPPGGMGGGGGGGGMGGSGGGGGMGGAGGGRGGARSGGMRGAEGSLQKAIKVWTRVTLAKEPAPVP